MNTFEEGCFLSEARMDRRYLEEVPQILTVNRSDVSVLNLEYPPTPSCVSFIVTQRRERSPGRFDILYLLKNRLDAFSRACTRAHAPPLPPPQTINQSEE